MAWYISCRACRASAENSCDSGRRMSLETPSQSVEPMFLPSESRLVGRQRLKRGGTVIVLAVLALLGAGILGFRTAVQMLKEKVVEALGPGSDVGELNVGWSSV